MKIFYKKILFTHDGSKSSAVAFDHVVALAKTFHAEVYILHVVDSVAKIIAAINSANATLGAQEIFENIAKSEKRSARANLNHIKMKLSEVGIADCVTILREGDARDEIVAVAKEKNCDLIIMSTHGRSGIKRALLGSVAEDVMRHSPCPVLLIRAKK